MAKRVNLLIIISIFCLILSSCKKEESYFQTAGEIFKTSYQIKYKYTRALGEEIHARLDSFDLSLNPFNKESTIYKVNNNEEVELDDWFIEVFNKAKEVSQVSNGKYDITSAPLINLWGFGFSKMDSIDEQSIDSLKEFVGYNKIRLDGRKVIKDDPRTILNASSIAKGYACDVIGELLDSYGITDYMVEIGGELNTKGKNPNGTCWRIEILKPLDDVSGQIKERMEIVELCDKSLATSGNYRNYYIRNGKKYAHTINPLTGYPAESAILSSTVLHKNCIIADAFATAFMTMELEEAVSIGNQFPEMDYLFIYADSDGNLQEKRSINMDKSIINY